MIKPKTPVEEVFPYVPFVDQILIMTVEPGFGGQSFMADMMPKVRDLPPSKIRTMQALIIVTPLKVRALRDRFPHLDIEVDGGLAPDTIDIAAKAGANMIVAGSAIFNAEDPKAVVETLRHSVLK